MSPEEERRRWALGKAVEVAARQQVGKYSAGIIVNVAADFEKYAKDGRS